MNTFLDVDSLCKEAIGQFNYYEVRSARERVANGKSIPVIIDSNRFRCLLFKLGEKYFGAKWKFQEEALEFISEKELSSCYVKGLKGTDTQGWTYFLTEISLTEDQKEYLILSATIDNL